MFPVMAASARKRFSATRSTHVRTCWQQWGEPASFPETLPYVELIRALPIIQPQECLHAVVELADDGENNCIARQNEQGHPIEGFGRRSHMLG